MPGPDRQTCWHRISRSRSCTPPVGTQQRQLVSLGMATGAGSTAVGHTPPAAHAPLHAAPSLTHLCNGSLLLKLILVVCKLHDQLGVGLLHLLQLPPLASLLRRSRRSGWPGMRGVQDTKQSPRTIGRFGWAGFCCYHPLLMQFCHSRIQASQPCTHQHRLVLDALLRELPMSASSSSACGMVGQGMIGGGLGMGGHCMSD